jgi:hypothetical protein
MSLDQGLKVSDNGATHCVNFLKDFIYHPGVIKTTVFWKLVLLQNILVLIMPR